MLYAGCTLSSGRTHPTTRKPAFRQVFVHGRVVAAMGDMVRPAPARLFVLALAVFGLVGCAGNLYGDDDQAGDHDSGPGAHDGGVPDAVPGASGLVLHWVADPQPPAAGTADGLAPSVTIKEVELNLFVVRAIGDSAPGDARTSVAELE